jgi:hypothetical protein
MLFDAKLKGQVELSISSTGREKSITARGCGCIWYRADSGAKRKSPGIGVQVRDLIAASNEAEASSI